MNCPICKNNNNMDVKKCPVCGLVSPCAGYFLNEYSVVAWKRYYDECASLYKSPSPNNSINSKENTIPNKQDDATVLKTKTDRLCIAGAVFAWTAIGLTFAACAIIPMASEKEFIYIFVPAILSLILGIVLGVSGSIRSKNNGTRSLPGIAVFTTFIFVAFAVFIAAQSIKVYQETKKAELVETVGSELEEFSDYLETQTYPTFDAEAFVIPTVSPSPTPEPTSTPIPPEPEELFLDHLYAEILDRDPDEAGKERYLPMLTEEGGAEEVVRELFGSGEFENRNLTNEEYVTILYRAVLNRDYDVDGYISHISALYNEQVTREGLLDVFLDTDEWVDTLEYYGL